MASLWWTSIATILLLGALLGMWLLVRRATLEESGQSTSPVERILASSGSTCCMETVMLLRALKQGKDEQAYAAAWMRISGHLERTLPACPQAMRALVGKHLQQAAEDCPSRSIAKSMSLCAARC